MGRPSSYRLRWANLYRSGQGRLRTAAGASLEGRRVRRRPSERATPGRRETAPGIPRKSRDVYAVITDFSLQYQRSERTGTELGTACRRRCRTPMPLDRRGRSHTKWRDRPTALEAVRILLAPVPAGRAAAARERPQLRRMPRCLPISTAPSASLRSATRAPGRRVTQRGHTPAPGALALRGSRPCQGKRMPPYSYRPALGGRREYGGHTPSWQGRAVRGGSPRGGVPLGRCAPSRTAPGSGCPLRPRCRWRGRAGAQNG